MHVRAIAVQKTVLSSDILSRAIGMIFFLWATALAAYVYIPIFGTPVPVTLQTFFVVLAGALLRRRDSVLTMGMYVGLGALGLPFFAAGSAGLGYFTGVTAGYLIGFIVAVGVIGFLLSRRQPPAEPTVYSLLVAMAAGISVIYLCGSAWLSLVMHLSWADAWRIGAFPFVPADTVKVVTAAMIVRQYHRRHGRWGGA